MSLELRTVPAVLALCLVPNAARADLIIQEIVDGTLASGQPKWVEIQNTGTECVFLGDHEICYFGNGSTAASGCSDLPDLFLAPGASWIFAYEPASNTSCSPTMTCFQFVYGFAANQNGGASINGDDAVALRDDATGTVIDVYGVIGVDGTGTVWEYTDGYSVRTTTTAAPVFDPAHWFFGGVDSLEDPNGLSAEIALLQTLTSPGLYASCVPAFATYCTAGTSASGCSAMIGASGIPSASSISGFDLSASGVEGAKSGVFFFGTSGRQAIPWGGGTSFQCIVPPTVRAGLFPGAGTEGACDGSFAVDLNALWCPSCPKAAKNPGVGAMVQAQLWYRDPMNPSGETTSLSDAVEFTVTP